MSIRITHARRLTPLEERLLDVIRSVDHALDHDLLWNGYAHAYTPEAVSSALQTLKRRGLITTARRGWYVRVEGVAALDDKHAPAGEGS